MNNLTQYSPFFDTIADESNSNSLFNIGRGHHFSILQVKGQSKRIIVLWDEDHDVRVINALESILVNQHNFLFHFNDIVAIGERKGCLSIITNNVIDDFPESSITCQGDEWSLHVNDLEMMCNGTGLREMLNYLSEVFGIDKALSDFIRINRINKVLIPYTKRPIIEQFDIVD